MLIIVYLISIVLVQKTGWFIKVAPFVLAVANVCTLPFWNVTSGRL